MTETPPQSGSGRKKQTKSKAAPSIAGSILHSACSRPIVRLPMAGLRGRGPSCVFRPLLHIQKRPLRSTGVLCPALLSAKRGGILRRREWPLCYNKHPPAKRVVLLMRAKPYVPRARVKRVSTVCQLRRIVTCRP